MKRVWKPLNCGGKRLYEVLQIFQWRGGKTETVRHLVMADAPRFAANLVEQTYQHSEWHPDITNVNYIGKAVNVLMPESWWADGVPS